MKNNQAGGIVGFVVIGLVLVSLLAGGLYVSKTQGRQARENDTSTPQVAAPQKPKETTKPAPKQQTPHSTDQKGKTAPAGNTSQPAQNSTTRPAPQPTNQVATTGPSDDIPSTGPGETAATVLMLSVLSFTTYKFVQSRRDVYRSALKR